MCSDHCVSKGKENMDSVKQLIDYLGTNNAFQVGRLYAIEWAGRITINGE
jgi:hypothetical protein